MFCSGLRYEGVLRSLDRLRRYANCSLPLELCPIRGAGSQVKVLRKGESMTPIWPVMSSVSLGSPLPENRIAAFTEDLTEFVPITG